MRNLFTNHSLIISAGQAASGIAKRRQTLRVMSGHVWLTVEGISHDYWLSAGDTFTAIPGRLIVVEADQIDSRIDCLASVQWLGTLKLASSILASRFTQSATVNASLRRHRLCNDNC